MPLRHLQVSDIPASAATGAYNADDQSGRIPSATASKGPSTVLVPWRSSRVEPKDSSVLRGRALDELVSVVCVGEPLGGRVFGEQRFGVMSGTSVRTSIRGHVRSVVRSNLAVPMCPFSIRVQTFPIGNSGPLLTPALAGRLRQTGRRPPRAAGRPCAVRPGAIGDAPDRATLGHQVVCAL